MSGLRAWASAERAVLALVGLASTVADRGSAAVVGADVIRNRMRVGEPAP